MKAHHLDTIDRIEEQFIIVLRNQGATVSMAYQAEDAFNALRANVR